MVIHYHKFTITIADEKQPGMAVKVRDMLRILDLFDGVKIESYTEKEKKK